jgi:hypothetical protein
MKTRILALILTMPLACLDSDVDDVTQPSTLRLSDNELTALMVANDLENDFKRPEDAVVAGYAEAPPCLEGLGSHYVHFANFLDGEIDLFNPETLRYAPNEDGEVKLIAVEYSITTLFPKPEPLLGQEWVGPASTGIPGIPPIWFVTISVRHNPDGIFSTYNPSVACRGTGVALALEPCVDDPTVLCLVPSTCEALDLTACIEWEQSQG